MTSKKGQPEISGHPLRAGLLYTSEIKISGLLSVRNDF
jgi:hypothetical protein